MTEDDLKRIEQHFEFSEGEAWKDGSALIAEVRRLRELIDGPEAKVTRAVFGTVVVTELELAVNRAPERMAALIDAKMANMRDSLVMAIVQRPKE